MGTGTRLQQQRTAGGMDGIQQSIGLAVVWDGQHRTAHRVWAMSTFRRRQPDRLLAVTYVRYSRDDFSWLGLSVRQTESKFDVCV